MGKIQGEIGSDLNRPTNASLSYTLPHLRSTVELEFDANLNADCWEPLKNNDKDQGQDQGQDQKLELSDRGRDRFLAHLNRLKEYFGFNGNFYVRSLNDFPSDCGLASSASSFAALTMVAFKALTELTEGLSQGESLGESKGSLHLNNVESVICTQGISLGGPRFDDKRDLATQADWSRKGSGSSCRSFFGPWSVWNSDGACEVPELSQCVPLFHQVIVVSDLIKNISSSEAHKRVTSSELFKGRPERAEVRLRELIRALKSDSWSDAFEITWAEFWDMHALFETSKPSFGYMTAGSLEVLRFVRNEIWGQEKTGPLVTMDAGPNIHLLYRPEQMHLAKTVSDTFSGRFKVFETR
jgi:diphosphomevalonate decarboxylase